MINLRYIKNINVSSLLQLTNFLKYWNLNILLCFAEYNLNISYYLPVSESFCKYFSCFNDLHGFCSFELWEIREDLYRTVSMSTFKNKFNLRLTLWFAKQLLKLFTEIFLLLMLLNSAGLVYYKHKLTYKGLIFPRNFLYF